MSAIISAHLPVVDPALDVELAVLDRDGTIVAVNESWTAFCLYNGGDPAACGVGVSYLAACDAAPDDAGAARVAALIRAALDDDLAAATSVVISCDSPLEPRWFEVIVSPQPRTDGAGGATLMLRQVAAPRSGPTEEPAPATRGVHDVVIDHLHSAGLDLRRLPDGSGGGALVEHALDALDEAIHVLQRAALPGGPPVRRPP